MKSLRQFLKGLFIYDCHYLRCVSICDDHGTEENNGNKTKIVQYSKILENKSRILGYNVNSIFYITISKKNTHTRTRTHTQTH